MRGWVNLLDFHVVFYDTLGRTVRLLVKHLVRDGESVLVVSLDGEVDESDLRPLFLGIEKAKVQIVTWRGDG